MEGTLNADLGLVILTGLLVSIPVMLAGWFYAVKVAARYRTDPGYRTGNDTDSQEGNKHPASILAIEAVP